MIPRHLLAALRRLRGYEWAELIEGAAVRGPERTVLADPAVLRRLREEALVEDLPHHLSGRLIRLSATGLDRLASPLRSTP